MAVANWHRAGAAFDGLAAQYDQLWNRATIGRLQRDAVWSRLDSVFRPGDSLLDLGCGTGEDSLHFAERGVKVRAIDTSFQMVRVARARGVDASVLPIENLDRMTGLFDGAISNFGALNCVADLDDVRNRLASLIRPGGYLALGVLGRFCLWETAWYLLRGSPRKAFRRLPANRVETPFRVRVHHFTVGQLERAFQPEFTMIDWRGIGLAVPPSYIERFPNWLLRAFGSLDGHVAHWPLLRALADHRLIVFVRNDSR